MPANPRLASLLLLIVALMAAPGLAQDLRHAALKSKFGTYGDNGVPFFGQTLDARHLGEDWPSDNLTPRGIILNPGHGFHACFDPDLLRIALVWKQRAPGDYLAMNGMAPGSYRQPNRKAPAGQSKLPTPIGTPILANGRYPGWQVGDRPSVKDPREQAEDRAEVGLGALPPELGRWTGLRLDQGGPTLHYEVGGTSIEEQIRTTVIVEDAHWALTRHLRIAPHQEPLTVMLAADRSVTIPPSTEVRHLSLCLDPHLGVEPGHHVLAGTVDSPRGRSGVPPKQQWKHEVKVPVPTRKTKPGPFAAERVPLPVPNPWKRNVRPASFDFFEDGRLAMVTFDGDVWIADGVGADRVEVTWRRFASGLHEPMSLRIVEEQIIVFDRNGLVRLLDRDGNGEADFHENLSDVAAQTAETREFAMGFEPKPGGGYYLAKGGQVASTRGKLNGTLVEVSPDGRSFEVVASGLRQPFLGVDPKTGIVTASDQQGHWKPATPIHVIVKGDYYGFQPSKLGPKAVHPQAITEPPLWIPHFVNQSGARQVWLRNAKMGPLNDALIHIGYNRPAIFKVFLEADLVQGAVVPVLDEFSTGLLDGRVNPRDGLLYLAGLNIWGSVGKEIRGLYRVRPTGKPSWIPAEVRSFDKGLLLRFDQELDAETATNPASYTVDRWNYRRTHNYGSGHFKLDGEPGQESLPVASAYLSSDKRAVFLGTPDMQPAHTLRITYRVAAPTETPVIQTAFLTIHKLRPLDLPALGFKGVEVDLTPDAAVDDPRNRIVPTAALGKEVATRFGCVACHSTDGSKVVNPEPTMVVGPSWKGLYGSKREFTDGTYVKRADEVYLRESILDPARNVTKGFETRKTGVGMPSYLGVLNDSEVESLILYIKSLGKRSGS